MKEEKMKAKKIFYDYLGPENKKNLLQVVEDTKRGIRKKSIFFIIQILIELSIYQIFNKDMNIPLVIGGIIDLMALLIMILIIANFISVIDDILFLRGWKKNNHKKGSPELLGAQDFYFFWSKLLFSFSSTKLFFYSFKSFFSKFFFQNKI